jgi:hypothetical protein
MFSIRLDEEFPMKMAASLVAAWFAASLFAQNAVVGRSPAAEPAFRSETPQPPTSTRG